MRTRSLQVRLSVAAAVLIVMALAIAAFGLRAIFNQEIERRAELELSQVLNAVSARAQVDAAGKLVVDVALPDPRFDLPYGGLYWQVVMADGQRVRSRSLWDFVLAIPEDQIGSERHLKDLAGPNGASLMAQVRDITIRALNGDAASLRVIAAIDRIDLATAQRSFLHLLMLSLVTLGIILIAAMALFIRLALQPFDKLARDLQTIHAGTNRALRGDFPNEVQPVVDDLNRLIAFQDAAIDRARADAGDLAHGLKTPLAVLASVARQASGEGRSDLAEPIDEQVSQMRRQIERVLARARAGLAAALGRKAIVVTPVADKIVRALQRLPDTRSLHWDIQLAPEARFPGEEGDLTEILANLLDNARKWARSQIRLTTTTVAGTLTLCVEDDGPGMPEHQASHIARGQRWDSAQPGTGFGLAITQDLAEGYRGRLELGRSDLGGLKAQVTIPLPTA